MSSPPIEQAIADLRTALSTGTRAVLVAPPGTGKTTRVPLALLDEPWLSDASGGSTILMLEPRRIAARSAATYMAGLLGERVGDTVGYRTRGDTRVGARTRVEVITERLLTRRLQRDPELDGVGLVIFDEVHERSLDTDLGLALCLDMAEALRPDLRLVAMSATPDTDAISAVLSNEPGTEPATATPIITSATTAHPIETVLVGRDPRRRIEDEVAAAVLTALRDTTEGDVLVFLPGRREIRFTAERLRGFGVDTVPLTAGLDEDALRQALTHSTLGRKVVLATAVAQTSITIDGVSVVVDSGLERIARYDHARGMGGLVTVPVSRAAADQRRGRAGRQGPGHCYRLWDAATERSQRPQSEPEIVLGDLTQLVLDVAAWGVTDPARLRWITPPPVAAWAAATTTLISIGALAAGNSAAGNSAAERHRMTPDGRRIAELGAHPRLGRLMLDAEHSGSGRLGALLAAAIEAGERGDLSEVVERPSSEHREVARRWLRMIDTNTGTNTGTDTGTDTDTGTGTTVGALIAAAFPERVARRRGSDRHRYLTAAGVGVALPQGSPLAGADWLAIAELDRVPGADERIGAAAILDSADLEEFLAPRVERVASIDVSRDGTISSRTAWNLGAIVVRDDPASLPDRSSIITAAVGALRDSGAGLLTWSDAARALQSRVAFARAIDGSLPDCSDEAISQRADEWLPAHLGAVSRTVRLAAIAAGDVMAGFLDHRQRRSVDSLAPVAIDLPSGRQGRIAYGPDGPVLRVKLQEMFGTPTNPTVGGGRVPVTLHLLSPAGRPLQVTQDLASFWAGAYSEVRSEMRGRYPKHRWPDDPTTATAAQR